MLNKGPNFFVIGAAKSGTTSLCDLLGQHPQIFISNPKEPQYFSTHYGLGNSELKYFNLFKEADKDSLCGEGSVNYTMRDDFPDVAQRIYNYKPESKLIFLVRHPMERILSNWKMIKRADPDYKEFNEAVESPETYSVLLNRSKYWYQLEPYLKLFAQEQILILFFEDLKKEPQQLLKGCYSFLGLDTNFLNPDAGRPRNQASDQFHQTSFLKKLKAQPWLNSIFKWIPQGIKNQALKSSVLTYKPESSVEWEGEVYSKVASKLKGDTQQFLEFAGKSKDYWSF